ncbi:MAG: serine/threonine-protein kinase [Sandaracinaceae bacterium]
MSPDAPGETFPRSLGRYTLLEELAVGGMGAVFLAHTEGPGGFRKLVAVKRILPHLAREPAFVDRFLDEARLASRLAHPHIAGVHDVGEERGEYFLAMEYVEGVDLGRLTERVHASDDPSVHAAWTFVVAKLIADAAEGLHAAHELTDEEGASLEVVHRDVSPQNLLVGFDGAVRVLDFGLARARARLADSTSGAMRGRFEYMAPEQVEPGGSVTRQTDVWSLGVVLHEALTGRRLFARAQPMAVLSAVLEAPIAAPSSLAPTVPPTIDAVVARALARRREDRYATARELGADLRQALAEAGRAIGAPEVVDLLQRVTPEDLEASRRRRREALAAPAPRARRIPAWALVAAGVATIALLGAGAVLAALFAWW